MTLFERPRTEIADRALLPAAVLVPLVWRDEVPHFIFTKRTMTVAHHKGQISFPGGAAEFGDSGPVETALRETEEEIGLERQWVRILGCLDDLVTVTSFVVTPVVGTVDANAKFTPNAEEVAEIFELPAAAFLDSTKHRTESFEYEGTSRVVHIYEIENRVVWGVTGEIVHRFVSVFR